MKKLSPDEVRSLLQTAVDSFPHGACPTCECFLGYVAQLRVDASPESRELFASHKVERSQMHGCLGCDPCPPGNLFAEYTRKKRSGQELIQL